jgi:hypothetical protein
MRDGPIPLRRLYLLRPSPELLDCAPGAGGRGCAVLVTGGWRELRIALRRSGPLDVAIVDPFGPGGREAGLAEELRDLLLELRSAIVIAELDVDPGTVPILRTLHQWGASDVIDRPQYCTVPALESVLRRCVLSRAATCTELALPLGSTPDSRIIAARALRVLVTGGGPRELAAGFGESELEMVLWCRKAGLPDPERLIEWFRLLWSAGLLADPTRSLQAIAEGAGYAGADALLGSALDLAGICPEEVRERAVPERCRRVFQAEVADLASDDAD